MKAMIKELINISTDEFGFYKYLDENFRISDDETRVYFAQDGRLVRDETLKAIILLANNMYDQKEMDTLLSQLRNDNGKQYC